MSRRLKRPRRGSQAYRAKKEATRPSPEGELRRGKNLATINVDHADNTVGTVVLMRAIGTTDAPLPPPAPFAQIVDASKGAEASESGANFMLAVVKGIEPRDQVEAMLAAQMAAVHTATMTFARRLAHVETSRSRTAPRRPSTSSLARSPLRSRPSKITARRASRR